MSRSFREAQWQWLACPACREPFTRPLLCEACGREYHETAGIPDLRWPAAVDGAEERSLVQRMVEAYLAGMPFDGLVQLRMGESAAGTALTAHYLDYRASGMRRGRAMANMLLASLAERFGPPQPGVCLDVGCGSGTATFALAQNFSHTIAVDWSLPDLLLLKRRMEDECRADIVVAQANFLRLPVREAVLDVAVAVNVIEHMIDVRRGFTEIARALKPGGAFCGDSRNRFDLLLPEPHVKLRWVGLLPRRYAPRYVHWRRQLSYKGVRLLSYWELRQQLETAFSQSRVEYPAPSAYGASVQAGRVLSAFQRRLPGISRLLLPWFPSFVALGIR